jgi:hypothetical protein
MIRKLFKYSGVEEYRLKALEDKTVWFAHPHTFNDTYDCHLNIKNDIDSEKNSSSGHSIDMIKDLILSTYEKHDTHDAYHMNKKMTDTAIAWAKGEIDSEYLLEILGAGLNSVGVLCMMPTKKNKLMWAYYAQSLQGFVAEYEHSNIQFLPVTYSSSTVTNYLSDFILSPRMSINRILKTKSIEWSHEDERRLSLRKPDRPVYSDEGGFLMLESDCNVRLSAIYGGPKIKHAIESELIRIAALRRVKYQREDFLLNDN